MAMTTLHDAAAKPGQTFTVPRSEHAPVPVPFDPQRVAATVTEELGAALQSWRGGPAERLAASPRRTWTPEAVAGGRSRPGKAGRSGRVGLVAILMVGVAGLALGAVLARLPMTRRPAAHPAHPAQPTVAAPVATEVAPTEVWPPRAPPIKVASAPPAAPMAATPGGATPQATTPGVGTSRPVNREIAAAPTTVVEASNLPAAQAPVKAAHPLRVASSGVAPHLAASQLASPHPAASRPISPHPASPHQAATLASAATDLAWRREAASRLALRRASGPARRGERRLAAARPRGPQGLCGGMGAYERTLCLNTAMREADAALRGNYDRAVRARVDSSALSDYHDAWMTLRGRINGDPEGVVRGYYRLAGQLKAATRHAAASASLAGEL